MRLKHHSEFKVLMLARQKGKTKVNQKESNCLQEDVDRRRLNFGTHDAKAKANGTCMQIPCSTPAWDAFRYISMVVISLCKADPCWKWATALKRISHVWLLVDSEVILKSLRQFHMHRGLT